MRASRVLFDSAVRHMEGGIQLIFGPMFSGKRCARHTARLKSGRRLELRNMARNGVSGVVVLFPAYIAEEQILCQAPRFVKLRSCANVYLGITIDGKISIAPCIPVYTQHGTHAPNETVRACAEAVPPHQVRQRQPLRKQSRPACHTRPVRL
jgi:hypothetical protein